MPSARSVLELVFGLQSLLAPDSRSLWGMKSP
jgi:hypothetical protein